MPSVMGRLLLAILCLCVNTTWAGDAPVGQPIVLNDNMPALSVQSDIATWMDDGSRATVEQVAGSKDHFKFGPALESYPLNPYDTLWVKLSVKRPVGSIAQWTLNIPLPFVDFVSLYQADDAGQWTAQRAGDTLSQTEWPRQGTYPDFQLKLRDVAQQDLYLQIRNYKQLAIPIRLSTVQQRESQRQLELMGMGHG